MKTVLSPLAAQRIVEETEAVIGKNINMMDAYGHIITGMVMDFVCPCCAQY
jgi:sugar diacid utilization regulator